MGLLIGAAGLLPGQATAQGPWPISWQYSGTVSIDPAPQPYSCLQDIGGGNLRCTGWDCATQEDCNAKAPGTVCDTSPLIPPPDAATITKLNGAGIADGDPFVGCLHFDPNGPDFVPDVGFPGIFIGYFVVTGTNLWFGANPGPGHNHVGYVGDFLDQNENFPNSQEGDQAILTLDNCSPLICGTNPAIYDLVGHPYFAGREVPDSQPGCPGTTRGLCSSDSTPCNTTCRIAVCDLPKDPNDPSAPCVNAATDCAPGGACVINECWNEYNCAHGICTKDLVAVDPSDPNAVSCWSGNTDCPFLSWQICDVPLDPNNPKTPCVNPLTDCGVGGQCIDGKEDCPGGQGCTENDCPNAGDTCNHDDLCDPGPCCSQQEDAQVNRPGWLVGKSLLIYNGSSDTSIMPNDDLPVAPYDYWPFPLPYPEIAEGDVARCTNFAFGSLYFEDTDTSTEYALGLDLDLVERIVDEDRDCIQDSVDNCLGVYNPMQLDRGGLNTSTPDGVGDACQCGDVTKNGQVQINDATIIKRAILGLGPGINAPGNCNVIGGSNATIVDPALGLTADCLINDATIVKRAILGLGPGIGSDCGEPEARVVLGP